VAFRFVDDQKAWFPIATMCRVLGVSTSGYYAWRGRPPSARARFDGHLSIKTAASPERSRRTYGAPRVHADLKDQGLRVGRKRVARLMCAGGLQGVHRRRFIRTTRPDERAAQAPDLVNRRFGARAPDALWVADITYVSTWAGFLYLAVVLDACSRRVVGWSMAHHLRTELVLGALDMAVHARRPGSGLIHHSDRGCQYTSYAFGRRCREAGVMPSMGSTGDAYDNAMAESFLATLECELLDRTTFRNRTEARLAVFDYIEGFYNPHRRHSSLGQISPAEFERRIRASQDVPVRRDCWVYPARENGSPSLSAPRFDGHEPHRRADGFVADSLGPTMPGEVNA
jgi:putative transposase